MSTLRAVRNPAPGPDLDALERAIPDSASVGVDQAAATLARIGVIKARLALFEAGIVAQVVAAQSAPSAAGPRLLSVEKAAEQLGMSPAYIREHLAEMPVVRMGRRVLIDATKLDELIQRQGRKRSHP